MAPVAHKILITGTGRAGTTFLVRLLTELGLDTGYTRENWQSDFFPFAHAGLEKDPLAPDAPYIVKDPAFASTLEAALTAGKIRLDHVIVPVRDLDAATRSRLRLGGRNIPGGLTGTTEPDKQRQVLAHRLYQLIHALAAFDIPHTLLHFPRLVEDPDYTYSKLHFLLGETDLATFRAAFARIADPSLVHDYSGPTVPTAEFLPFAQFQAHRLLRARRARWYAAALVLTLAASAALYWS